MPNLHLIEMESDPAVNHKVLITLLDNTRVSISVNAADYSNLLTLLRYTIRHMTAPSTKGTHTKDSTEVEPLTRDYSDAQIKKGFEILKGLEKWDEREKIKAAAKRVSTRLKDVC